MVFSNPGAPRSGRALGLVLLVVMFVAAVSFACGRADLLVSDLAATGVDSGVSSADASSDGGRRDGGGRDGGQDDAAVNVASLAITAGTVMVSAVRGQATGTASLEVQ